MAKTVEIKWNMTNLEAQYFTIGDTLWRQIEYFASVAILSNVVGYAKNINIILQHISTACDQKTRYRRIMIGIVTRHWEASKIDSSKKTAAMWKGDERDKRAQAATSRR
ncbi:hypothetical protein BDR04DRAFT_1122518 [Suillus decipiens]|nr:hypothetical protein BDR04DRAFT_1122518 [Suillus decipiens]